MRTWGGLLVVLAAGAVLVGCSSPASESIDSGTKVALILPSSDSPYFEEVARGARESAQGASAQLIENVDAASIGSQVAAVRSAIDSGADAIVIAPLGPEIDAAVASARDAGVKVVEVGGTGYVSSTSDFVVQTDDCVLGIAAGQWLQGRMPEGSLLWPEFSANFLLVLGNDGEFPEPSCRDQGWFEGTGIPIDALAQAEAGTVPTGDFVGIPYSIPCVIRYAGDASATQQQITDCVRQHPQINAAYASTGTLARLAGEGLRRAGKTVGLDVVLTTVAGEDEGLDLARGSWVNAASRPRAAATGGFAVASALTLVEGGTPEVQGDKPFLDTGVDLCTDEPKTTVFSALTVPLKQCQ